MSGQITRWGRLVRIAIGLAVFFLNGVSLGRWLEPLVGWSISGAVWMTTNMVASLYIFYHTVQLIRQSKKSE